ncbi:MAG: selenide, water dikinase SelD [Bacteroidia bacterium]
MIDPKRLTQWSKASGCGCKIEPKYLHQIIKDIKIHQSADINLLIGSEHSDDAVVYALNDTEALVCTTDFFTPIVDDAFTFGQIAAANALSDIYAMGANPLVALSVLGWPVERLGTDSAQEVLRGAQHSCKTAGIVLAGGHSIETSEPFFGLTVNGRVKRNAMCSNNSLCDGDLVFITKPIGTGIYAKAFKHEKLAEEHYKLWIAQLVKLNRIGSILVNQGLVNAITDVTGFGLGGHLLEMLKPGTFSAHINLSAVPVLPDVFQYAAISGYPDALFKNWNAIAPFINDATTNHKNKAFSLFADPQTNGGLLCTVTPDNEQLFINCCKNEDQQVWKLGRIFASDTVQIEITD